MNHTYYLALCLSLITVTQLDAATASKIGNTRLSLRVKAPHFTCVTTDGQDISVAKLRGKVVLLNFFATWCAPCVAEMPYLQKYIYEPLKDRNDFLIISIGRENTTEELKNFRTKYKMTFPMAEDPNRRIFALYADEFIPRNVLIGKDGLVKYTSKGFDKSKFSDLLQFINRELNSPL